MQQRFSRHLVRERMRRTVHVSVSTIGPVLTEVEPLEELARVILGRLEHPIPLLQFGQIESGNSAGGSMVHR